MKKIILLTLLFILIAFNTGCSYEVTCKNTQNLQGKSENWKAEYEVEFITNYPEKEGIIYANSEQNNKILVTYIKDISQISNTKYIEISYKDNLGSGGKLTEDYNYPLTKKYFKLGGGSGTSNEFDISDASPQNLNKYIRIYSGPSSELRDRLEVTITVNLDGKTETIVLEKAPETKPTLDFEDKLNQWFVENPMIYSYEGHASDFKLKLKEADINFIADKSILNYELTLKNEGSKNLNGVYDEMNFNLIPNDKLRSISEETIGFDIFDEYAPIGTGLSTEGDIFRAKGQSKIIVSYEIDQFGVGKNPSKEDFEKLLKQAFDSSLVVTYKGEEAARLELKKYKNTQNVKRLYSVANNINVKIGTNPDGEIVLESSDFIGFNYEFDEKQKQYVFSFKLTDWGKTKIKESTTKLAKNSGELSLWVGDEVIVSPRVMEPITGDEFNILFADSSEYKASDFADKLKGK